MPPRSYLLLMGGVIAQQHSGSGDPRHEENLRGILVFLTRDLSNCQQQFSLRFCSKTSQGVLYEQKTRTPQLIRVSLL